MADTVIVGIMGNYADGLRQSIAAGIFGIGGFGVEGAVTSRTR